MERPVAFKALKAKLPEKLRGQIVKLYMCQSMF